MPKRHLRSPQPPPPNSHDTPARSPASTDQRKRKGKRTREKRYKKNLGMTFVDLLELSGSSTPDTPIATGLREGLLTCKL